jgi:hypothetical protein
MIEMVDRSGMQKVLAPPAISVPHENSINPLLSGDEVSSPVRNDSFKTLHPIEKNELKLFE